MDPFELHGPDLSMRMTLYDLGYCEGPWQQARRPSLITVPELRAAVAISELFEPQWRRPMEACFLALRPNRRDDPKIMHLLSKTPDGVAPGDYKVVGIEDRDRAECAPWRTTAMHSGMPEVQEFGAILRQVTSTTDITSLIAGKRRAISRPMHMEDDKGALRFPGDI